MISWEVWEGEHGINVVPRNDLRQHELGTECWCGAADDDGVIIHRSLDGREAYESGRRKVN